MKRVYKWLMFAVICLVLSCVGSSEAKAAETSSVSVTVPTSLDLVFQEDGTNAIGTLAVSNQSPVPIAVTGVSVSEFNGWNLADEDAEIPVDTKQLVFQLEEKCLYAGGNELNVSVSEYSEKSLSVAVRRGAFTYSAAAEKALELEFEYVIGQKEFQLTFDGNESDDPVAPVGVLNGDSIELPVPERVKYLFLGWQDSGGNLYNGTYTMPMGDVTLKAVWQWTEAYALYFAEDQSLVFVRSVDPIVQGQIYNGKTVTGVYTGFEDAEYYRTEAPWMEYRQQILTIDFQDVIQPTNTAYWFFCIENAYDVDVTNLDVSKTINMTSMFSDCGFFTTGSFRITGIAGWDVSNVQIMNSLFRGMGNKVTEFYIEDISHWDTSNCWSIRLVFASTGMNAQWSMDCSGWDVSKATVYEDFNYHTEDKVIQPIWVN